MIGYLAAVPPSAIALAATTPSETTGGLVQYGVLGIVSAASMSALWWMVKQTAARADRLEQERRDMEPRARADRLETELRELNHYLRETAVPAVKSAVEATAAVMRYLDRQGTRP